MSKMNTPFFYTHKITKGFLALVCLSLVAACTPGKPYKYKNPQVVADPDKVSAQLAQAADKASQALQTLAAIEQTRRDVISRGDDPVTSVVLSTIFYLEESERRGSLLQALLRVPEIKQILRAEREELRRQARAPVLASMQARYGMSAAEAEGANAILSAIVRRGGSLLADGRIDHDIATRLCLSIVLAGMRSNAGGAAATPSAAPGQRSPPPSAGR